MSAPYDMHLGLEDWFTGNEFHYNVPFSGLNLRDQVYTWLSSGGTRCVTDREE